MPGDFNRTLLTGYLIDAPIEAGAGVRFALRSAQRWSGRDGQPRSREDDFRILVMHPALVAFSRHFRQGDKVMVEGTLEPSGTVVLGALHSSIQLLAKASEAA